jgi:hypothetical protein
MISRLMNEQRPLMVAGIISFALFVLMVGLSFIDSTEILGINRWIKPMKFFISISIFLWTIAVYLYYLKGNEAFARRISWGIITVMIIEMTIITGQAARGTMSHFNNSTPLNSILFAVMGTAIIVNTILVALILYKYFGTEIYLPKTILWGMRLGLIVFLLGSLEGGYMSAQTGHTIGAADGGPGLPGVNWSTIAGDLRIAHFLGLHALQAIPLVAYLIEKIKLRAGAILTVAFAAAYFAIFTLVFIQALMGRPLLAI